MGRKRCESISKFWISFNPCDPEPFGAAAAQAGVDDSVGVIGERRAAADKT